MASGQTPGERTGLHLMLLSVPEIGPSIETPCKTHAQSPEHRIIPHPTPSIASLLRFHFLSPFIFFLHGNEKGKVFHRGNRR